MSHEQTPEGSPAVPPAPVLSYKKKPKSTTNSTRAASAASQARHSADKSAEMSAPQTPTSVPGTPTLGGSRKVSSRRKALQDFYKLNQADAAADGPSAAVVSASAGTEDQTPKANSKDGALDIDTLVEKLDSPGAMAEFMKTASVGEMLRARNAAASKLNLHDSEKKSIIYNNYSELIKLNHVLSDVYTEKAERSAFSLPTEETQVSNKTVDEYLAELSNFFATEAAVFNQEFSAVVDSISTTFDGADSSSSVRGIVAENGDK